MEYFEILNHIDGEHEFSDIEKTPDGRRGIPKNSIILLSGPPGSTKSTYAYYLATHMYVSGISAEDHAKDNSIIYLFDANLEIYKEQITRTVGRSDLIDTIVREIDYWDIAKAGGVKKKSNTKSGVTSKGIHKAMSESFEEKNKLIVIDSISSLIDAIQWPQQMQARRSVAEHLRRWYKNGHTVILISEDVRDNNLTWLTYNCDIHIEFELNFHKSSTTRSPIPSLQVLKYRGRTISGKKYYLTYTTLYENAVKYTSKEKTDHLLSYRQRTQ